MQNKTIEAYRVVFSRNLPRGLRETPTDPRAIGTVGVGVQTKCLPNTEVEHFFLINWFYFSLLIEDQSMNNVEPS